MICKTVTYALFIRRYSNADNFETIGNKTQIPAKILEHFLFYLVTLNPIKKIKNPDPPRSFI